MLTRPDLLARRAVRLATRRRGRIAPVSAVLSALLVLGLGAALLVAGSVAADRQGAEPPSVAVMEGRATEQGFSAIQLLGNDAIGAPGARVVVERVRRAWEASKRMYLGKPQNPARSRALAEVFERWQRKDDRLHGNTKRDDWRVASVRLRLMAPSVRWPGESDRAHRTRIAAVLAADRASSSGFWKQVREAKNSEPSESVKAVCGVVALGPGVLGAISTALSHRKGTDSARQIREACEKAGKRVRDTAETVAKTAKDVITDPLGTLAKGLFGPLLKELQSAAAYASKQVGGAIDKVAAPDLSEQWLRQMLKRSATIAVLIALVAGILGVIHAAVTGSLSALMTVVARALISGVAGSVLLTMLNVAVVFVDMLTGIAIGAEPGQTGKRFSTFAATATKAMSAAEVPSFVALLLLLALLLGLVVVWWEMWLRAPLLYAVAFFYPPAFSASLFPPAKQLLGHLNALLAAIVLMPLVVLSLLEMSVTSLQGSDTINAVLQATGLLLLAAASPAILVALFSPSVALSAAAGMAGAMSAGRTVGRAGRRAAGGAATATLGAAGFAKDRLTEAATGRPGNDSQPGSRGADRDPRNPNGGGGGTSARGLDPTDRGGSGPGPKNPGPGTSIAPPGVRSAPDPSTSGSAPAPASSRGLGGTASPGRPVRSSGSTADTPPSDRDRIPSDQAPFDGADSSPASPDSRRGDTAPSPGRPATPPPSSPGAPGIDADARRAAGQPPRRRPPSGWPPRVEPGDAPAARNDGPPAGGGLVPPDRQKESPDA